MRSRTAKRLPTASTKRSAKNTTRVKVMRKSSMKPILRNPTTARKTRLSRKSTKLRKRTATKSLRVWRIA